MELCESCEHAWLIESCLLAVIVNGSGNDYIRSINCVQSIWNSTKEGFRGQVGRLLWRRWDCNRKTNSRLLLHRTPIYSYENHEFIRMKMGRIFKQLKVYSASRSPEQTVCWSTSETEKEGTWYIR